MKITLNTPNDFSFLETMQAHGWRRLLPFRWVDEDGGVLERVEEIAPSELALLRIRDHDGKLEVDSSLDISSEEIVRRVRHMLQLDLPIDEFHAYCADRPELSHIPGLRQGRMLRSPTMFEDVLKVLATTNTTWTQTIGMISRLVDNFGSPLESDPSCHAFPRPEQIANVPLEEFAALAKMGYRNAAAHKIASEVASGALNLESWNDPAVSTERLNTQLLSLPGIGPYAASCLKIYSGRYDRVNVDSWARMMVGKELRRAVTDKEVHQFFEPYGKWKALAYHFYKWKEEEPAY